MTKSLTRAQAIATVADAATSGLEALLALQEHWVGHRAYVPEADEAATVAELEYANDDHIDTALRGFQRDSTWGSAVLAVGAP